MHNQTTRNKYFDKVTKLLKQARPKLTTTHRLSFKNVFGAVGGYVNGRIFISCGAFGVALKLPLETRAAIFREKDIRHLKYFRKGHVKKEYAILPKRILENTKQFKELLGKSIKNASLPNKTN